MAGHSTRIVELPDGTYQGTCSCGESGEAEELKGSAEVWVGHHGVVVQFPTPEPALTDEDIVGEIEELRAEMSELRSRLEALESGKKKTA